MKEKLKLLFCLFVVVCAINVVNAQGRGRSSKKSPSAAKEKTAPSIKTVNIFVENSGSMFGYIFGGNEFDKTLNSLLTQLSICPQMPPTINMYYINSKVYQQNCSVDDFIKGVAKHNSKNWPGNLGCTDMSALIDTVMGRTDNQTISFFISDCIFSLGKNQDASKYIEGQKGAITRSVSSVIKQRDMAILVYRYLSRFNGTFYNHQDDKIKLSGNSNRPFFVWAFGTKSNLAVFYKNIPPAKIDNKLAGYCSFFTHRNSNVKCSVNSSPEMAYRRVDNKTIDKAKLVNGKLKLTISVDLSSCALLGDEYLTNPKNYIVSNSNYKIVSVKRKSGVGSTHVFTVETTSKVTSSKIAVSLKTQLPEWVSQYNLDPSESNKIFKNLDKTYGIKSILDAVSLSYNNATSVAAKFELKIN